MLSFQSAAGYLVLLGLAWLISERRHAVAWRPIAWGVALQLVLALLLTKVSAIQHIFTLLNGVVVALNAATRAGTSFVFGYVGGAEPPWAATGAGSSFILGFQSLPLVLVVSALSALLFHWNVIPPVVRAFTWVLRRTIGIDGPAGMATTMNMFVGMVEAPLVIRPYLRTETRAGLFVILTAGMAMVAGTVMVLYATMLDGVVPNALGQILTATILAAPATIIVSYIMVPEDPAFVREDLEIVIVERQPSDNIMSVITRGTLDGVQLLIAIIAMLIVLVALVSLANQAIALLPDVSGTPLSLQRMLGWVLSPLAWLLGIPWTEAPAAGALLGTKTVLNELIAYTDLSHLTDATLSQRSRLIMTYALCGFANFGSLGILIGGMTAMVPERRADIVALAPRTLISGTLATCLSGAIIGALSWL